MPGRTVLPHPRCLSSTKRGGPLAFVLCGRGLPRAPWPSCVAGVVGCMPHNSQPWHPLAMCQGTCGEGPGFPPPLAELLFGVWSSEVEVWGGLFLWRYPGWSPLSGWRKTLAPEPCQASFFYSQWVAHSNIPALSVLSVSVLPSSQLIALLLLL